ncbi:uncharacterized protein LOC103512519 isoform X2 [Diaphorina citri]|uniref:Uncharacterized protein LOC103512519 isoform X2 n=1 Tax=Diaphorina citri TaxID=121845 RepID=A0A3Q0J4B5_DIACI|nr:uncharacterized protein LOC103512519 isoform X2 [Diaphorina citri]
MRDSFSNTKDTMNENLEAADDYNPEKDLSNAKTDPDNNNNIQRYGIRSACSQIMVAVAQNFLLVALETEDRTLQEITDFFEGNISAREFKRQKGKSKNNELDNLM